MKIAFLMDPLETVKPYKDTTYFIMLGAQERGHQVYFFQNRDLYFQSQSVFAVLTELKVSADHAQPFQRLITASTDLAEMDVIFVRTDPPFDRRYFYATLLLDLLPASTRVLNRPSALRDWNEKLSSFFYTAFTPDSLVSSDINRIKQFLEEKGRIVVKPIDGHGGRGIFFLAPKDPNLDQILQEVTQRGSRWVIAQTYVPAASIGDKRILLLNGEPMGAILRVHPEGKELNNLDAGGTANKVDLTERDLALCAALKPALIEKGLFFVGIDVIGDSLMEINVTSPTGLQEMSRFNNEPLHHRLIEALE